MHSTPDLRIILDGDTLPQGLNVQTPFLGIRIIVHNINKHNDNTASHGKY